jgi:hypothetical protein
MITLTLAQHRALAPHLSDRARLLTSLKPIVVEVGDNFTVGPEHNGVILKQISDQPTTVIVQADLELGFSCAVAQYGGGKVMFVAGAGVQNRTPATGISRQYGIASLLVIHPAEFVLGGDIV